jgi:hypothetical protein
VQEFFRDGIIDNMDGINRKPMRDVLVPTRNVPTSRPSSVPTPQTKPVPRETENRDWNHDRIEKNPFFEKIGPERRGVTPAVRKKNHRGLLSYLAVVIFFAGGFVLMNYFASATVDITPSSQKAHIDQTFTASKDGTGADLMFRFMSLSETQTKHVPDTIDKNIKKNSTGTVVIYNAYNGDSQRLIKNTRLESSDHKIFRLNDSVVVPGAKISKGKIIEPGSVFAVVYADVADKDYNIGLSDFTIPGFKGDPRYSKFTARSKPDSPIGGGFSGKVMVPTDEAIATAQAALKDTLTLSAIEKARGQIPDKVTFFPGSIVLKFEEVPQDFNTGNATSVSVRAIVSVFFFDTIPLTQKLAEKGLTNYFGTPLSLEDVSKLKFTFIDPIDSIILSDIVNIRFKIVGDAAFVGQIDTKKIQLALVGKEKSDFAKIVGGEDNVGKADAVIRPMWNTVFPLDVKKITVNVLSPEK